MPTEPRVSEAAMLSGLIPPPRAWHGPDLREPDFKMALPADCLAELDGVVAEQRKAPVPTLVLQPEHFAMDACRALMAAVRHRLDRGLGFVILDRLPIERWSQQELIDVYWLLGCLLEPPVAQEWKGTMIYDVRYDGAGYTPDTRAALTPEGLDMHNDSSMGEAPANYVALLCLRTAKCGGMSSLASAYAAHNFFRSSHPQLLPRLYQAFYRDKQDYQAPDADNWYPIFAAENGGLRIRFNAKIIKRGYLKSGRPLDPQGLESVELMQNFLTDPAHRHDFWIERGQVQVLNNRSIVHGRTPYEDFTEPERRRHLVRLWLRAGDRRQFRG
jgi:Taurine catabolism dioxygenase TauD, TfdA family